MRKLSLVVIVPIMVLVGIWIIMTYPSQADMLIGMNSIILILCAICWIMRRQNE